MLTEKIELSYWCSSELKLQGRTRNRIVEDQVVSVTVKARSIPNSHMQTVESDGVLFRVCQSQKSPGVFYTVSDWGSTNSKCTCPHSSLGNLCKHEVKAMLMDGYSETQILLAFGRKCGSVVEGLVQGQLTSTSEVEEDTSFHFPFACQEEAPAATEEPKICVETILTVFKNFEKNVEGDSFYLSHLLIHVKESVEEVLSMKARLETNTSVHEDLDRIIPPFEIDGDGGEGAILE
ncbi:hypothetical protein R1sor_004556 [Riccia sorocarpa]|uniref:SWIM-type domain-containing protein n=1 Tax=Riccia sorocarpa TaxID=122646 RepID=A0ABD3HLD5_9MARC